MAQRRQDQELEVCKISFVQTFRNRKTDCPIFCIFTVLYLLKINPHILFAVGLLSAIYVARAQTVSQFDWNGNTPTLAVVGPNASSIGASAVTSTGGVGGTKGLNPGAPTANDINMNIPNTGGVFDVANIDVSIDYRRNESTANMLRRGTFSFHPGSTAGSFQVTFRVNNGSGGTTVTSTVTSIPQDATFRNYRFTYDNCTGVGTAYVNNVVVWSSPTPTANQNLYWVGDGNVVIGQDMDGANNNIPNLDNFVWKTYTCSTLPIELSSFSGNSEGTRNFLKWTTATEKNNDFFTVERSVDGDSWVDVATVYGSGNSTTRKTYSTYDNHPEKTVNYYRLRQTDFDGSEKKYSIITIDNTEKSTGTDLLRFTDLLGRQVDPDCEGVIFIHYPDGQVIKKINQ